MNIRSSGSTTSADPADGYSVAVVKKQQDQEKAMGKESVRLIDAAGSGPQSRPPGPNSTVSVIA